MRQSKAEMFLGAVAGAARAVFEEIYAVERARGATRAIPTLFEHEHEHEAPVFGVQRAIEHAGGRCFILAVDYGRITAAVLRDLRERVERSAAPVAIPRWRGVRQPLCGGWSPAVAPLIARRIAEGKLDLIGLVEESGGEVFPYDAPELVNMNTPEDMGQEDPR